MLKVPSDHNARVRFANDLIEQCRSSVGIRAAYYRLINAIVETGRQNGSKALINMMFNHVDRMASHLYSPVELRFTVGFENMYPKNVNDRAEVVARALTKTWEKHNLDTLFEQGVFESCKYGACIQKQMTKYKTVGDDQIPVYPGRIVMPWQFGVYREDLNKIEDQPAVCETTYLSMPEVRNRIANLPDADGLYKRIEANSSRQGGDESTSFLHQVLSTSQIDTSLTSATTPTPGGIVQLNSDPNYSIMSPNSDVDMVRMHELWVQEEQDYVMLQLIEPDILITRYANSNGLIPGKTKSGLQPYTLIQSNVSTGYFWGRSAVADLIEPQGFLNSTSEDIRRLFGLQVDKLIGFAGDDTIVDERYDQMRAAGYMSAGPGSTISDLTPRFPPEALPLLKAIMDIMNLIAGFPDIMQGKGETGVRAGVHANTLLKTASPRLRSGSLLIERQCAAAADKTLKLMVAKDARNYWTKADTIIDTQDSAFLLSNMPGDMSVAVDSHSSSPIFIDDHAQLTVTGMKLGVIGPEDVLDDLPFPNKDLKKQRLRERQAAKAKQTEMIMQKYPELGEKMASKELTGRAR